MIIPTSRLLFWMAVVVLPFAALAGVYPDATLISLVLIGGMVAFALVDAVLALGRLDGIAIELPEVLRVSKDRSTILAVRIRNASQKPTRLRLGLGLPPELGPENEDVQVGLPEGNEWSQLEWRITPSRRGNYRITRAHLETGSRFGLWAVRRAIPTQGEVRVYPNLIAERKQLAALFLNRGMVGLHAQRQVGKGRDFEKLREYIAGDSYDEIHWKATAKRGIPVTKVFQIERTQEVYVIIDASRLSARQLVSSFEFGDSRSPAASAAPQPETRNPKPDTSVLERFLTSALILGQAAEHQGDLFGLITFADQVQTFLRARNGKEHYSACRDAIYTLEASETTPDFDEIGAFIRTRLRRRALLIFLTSLDDPVLAESFVRNMGLLAGQHLVLVNMLKPPGAEPLFSQPDVEVIDDLYRHLGGHLQWQKLRELEKVLQRRGVRFSLVENDRLTTELVTQYVGVKQRQLI
jgi:uncharacterized protein (DUF58 family)